MHKGIRNNNNRIRDVKSLRKRFVTIDNTWVHTHHYMPEIKLQSKQWMEVNRICQKDLSPASSFVHLSLDLFSLDIKSLGPWLAHGLLSAQDPCQLTQQKVMHQYQVLQQGLMGRAEEAFLQKLVCQAGENPGECLNMLRVTEELVVQCREHIAHTRHLLAQPLPAVVLGQAVADMASVRSLPCHLLQHIVAATTVAEDHPALKAILPQYLHHLAMFLDGTELQNFLFRTALQQAPDLRPTEIDWLIEDPTWPPSLDLPNCPDWLPQEVGIHTGIFHYLEFVSSFEDK
ncbi:hypothetical protein LAZ67_20000743 [Cordylochernes scorpioides]|uniref:Uncharacterized protein n=1 Tax=Cordylochernes scorpioides TaxID=51811 RepID=A0ABY6LJB1_9ARAC|nr:hypothetical protein LAZ67_20000743 [Cordylochernes scorpioides]